MRTYLLASVVVTMGLFASCGGKQQGMTENQMQAKVDSIVAERVEALNQHYLEDLEKRMAIEVKVKADSIVAAREAGQ